MPLWNEPLATQAEVDAIITEVTALEGRQRYTWQSTLVTSADIVGGGASEAIVLAPAFPANVEIVAAYFQITTTASSSNAVNTATLTLQLGISGSPNSYLAAGANMFGFAAGFPSHFAGGLLGTMRSADTPRITLTCTGAAPNTGNVLNLGVIAFVEYFLPRAGDA